MMKKLAALIAAALLATNVAFAGIQERFLLRNAASVSEQGEPNNFSETPVRRLTESYALGEISWTGLVTPTEGDPGQYPSWGNELHVYLTHTPDVGTAVSESITLGSGGAYGPGPANFSGNSYALKGTMVGPNDTFTFELYESLDDEGVDPDAIWNTLRFDLHDLQPVTDPVAPGFIRIDTTGSASYPTTSGGAGENFWGIEYGADTGGLPAIQSVLIKMGEDVRGVDGAFDPGEPNGTFVANTLNGISGVTETFSDVDEDFPNRHGRLLLEFPAGDFEPGDSIRCGVGIEDAARRIEAGDQMILADPAVEIIVTFEDESEVSGLITELGRLAGPDVTLFSYVDIDAAPVPPNPADFNTDGLVDDADLAAWSAGFGTDTGAVHEQGDANEDGDVDGSDFLIWQQNLGFGTGGSLAAAAVPEPASVALLAFGLVLFVPRRRLPASCAALLLCTSIASATVQDTISILGAPSMNYQGDGANHIEFYFPTSASP